MLSPEEFVSGISDDFALQANPEEAKSMSAYMKYKFEFFGLKSATRRGIQKEYLGRHGQPPKDDISEIAQLLWSKSQRECQYFATDLIRKHMNKLDSSFLSVIEKLIVTKSWWDSVDALASPISGTIFKNNPKMLPVVTDRWAAGNNLWLQRSAIIFQLTYKSETDTTLLRRYILMHAHSKEFFIQKAIGWALRQFSKSNPSWVEQFVQENILSALSQREAMKYIVPK